MYQRILIVVDGRQAAKAAIREGTALAASQAAEALFFAVLPRMTTTFADADVFATVSADEFMQSARENAERLLQEASRFADEAGVRSRTLLGNGDDDAKCVIEAAQKSGCDIIVIASQGRNAVMRLLTGSAIPGLITASPMPVLVCKPGPADDDAQQAEEATLHEPHAGVSTQAPQP